MIFNKELIRIFKTFNENLKLCTYNDMLNVQSSRLVIKEHRDLRIITIYAAQENIGREVTLKECIEILSKFNEESIIQTMDFSRAVLCCENITFKESGDKLIMKANGIQQRYLCSCGRTSPSLDFEDEE